MEKPNLKWMLRRDFARIGDTSIKHLFLSEETNALGVMSIYRNTQTRDLHKCSQLWIWSSQLISGSQKWVGNMPLLQSLSKCLDLFRDVSLPAFTWRQNQWFLACHFVLRSGYFCIYPVFCLATGPNDVAQINKIDFSVRIRKKHHFYWLL